MMRKKIIVITTALILAVVWGIAYYHANQTPFQVPTEYYAKGDLVDIGRNFFDMADENPEGYKLQVQNAGVMTFSAMLEELGEDEEAVALVDADGYPRPEYVYDVTLRIVNSGNTAGYVLLSRYMLTDKALTLDMNYDLWELLYPEQPGLVALTLDPDSEITIRVPFTASPRNQRKFNNLTNQRISTGEFAMCISEYPVRKMLWIQ